MGRCSVNRPWQLSPFRSRAEVANFLSRLVDALDYDTRARSFNRSAVFLSVKGAPKVKRIDRMNGLFRFGVVGGPGFGDGFEEPLDDLVGADSLGVGVEVGE